MAADLISVTDPIAPAWQRTRRALFEPFQARTWFTLGFCCFLAQLGSRGGSSVRVPGNTLRGTEVPNLSAAQAWAAEHVLLLSLLGAGLLLVLLAFGLLLLWLSSRGRYMFLDGVVRGVAEVVGPWRRFRAQGNSLAVFRFLLALIGLGAMVVSAGLGALVALPSIRAHAFGPSALAGFLVGGGLFFATAVILAIVSLLLNDFVVPISYQRDLPAAQAFQILRRDLLAGRGVTFLLFYLMKLALGLGAAVIMVLGTCLTCCLAALPYLSSVAFLPVFVFFQNYNLGFLAQFGPEWDLLAPAIPSRTAEGALS